MIREIQEDLSKVESSSKLLIFLSNRGFQALLFYRVSHFLFKKKIPLIPLFLTRIIQIVYSIDIDYKAQIEGGCCIVHGVGLVIGSGVVIGKNSKLYHGVTLGVSNSENNKDGFPYVGENVLIGAGAKVLGKVKIGDNSKIGANSVVLKDVPKNCIAFGIPAQYKESKNKRTLEVL
ncbi:serine O-acetyltransferase EpsC [Priestia aryabhattai]|uniref:serine O-acetyltransferase EpsC n=1 Tax=Priestia aryabhattai TaxID=412384 RepID=UPI0007ABAB50|nr:serine O-acetyltransferase EpsC [Priestia aryabhattai]KZE14006.1 serine acetyltransferase [Priestia aryabhattai]